MNKNNLHRTFILLKKNSWVVDMWKEYEKVRSKYYEKISKIEQKYFKIAKKRRIKNVWFASTLDNGIFGIDINNARMHGKGKDRFLIHDSDIEKFIEKFY